MIKNNIYKANKLKTILCVGLFCLMAVSLYIGITKGLRAGIDFQWDSAKVLALRENPYLASIDSTNEYHYLFSEIFGELEANQFPFLLWLLFPYTFLTPSAARVAWIATNLFCVVGCIFLLRKTLWAKIDRINYVILLLLLLGSGPIRKQLFLGQHTVFSLFFFLLALYLDKRGKENLTGMALAISYFKYSLTVPLMVIFIAKKKYRPVIISFAIHIVLTLFSSVWLGVDPVTLMIQPLQQAAWLAGAGFADLSALFSAIGINGMLPNLCTVVIFLGLFVWAVRCKRTVSERDFVMLFFWSLIFMYHRRYDYFVMIIPMAYIYFNSEVSEIKNKKMRKITCMNRVSILWIIVGLFVVDAFADPMTSVGMRLNSMLPNIYENAYSVYCKTLIVAFYLSFISFYALYNYLNKCGERTNGEV